MFSQAKNNPWSHSSVHLSGFHLFLFSQFLLATQIPAWKSHFSHRRFRFLQRRICSQKWIETAHVRFGLYWACMRNVTSDHIPCNSVSKPTRLSSRPCISPWLHQWLFSARVCTHPCISPRVYTRTWTPHSPIAGFLLLTFFVVTLNGICPLFALFLHLRESYWCFSVFCFVFFCCYFFFFASQENSHSHYFKPMYKPIPRISPSPV